MTGPLNETRNRGGAGMTQLTPEQELIECFDQLFFEDTTTDEHFRKCVVAYMRWRSDVARKSCALLKECLASERI